MNHKNFVDYFLPASRDHVLEPFIATATAGLYDVYCTVKGGGFTGQAGALRLGISKALEVFKPDAHSVLRRGEHIYSIHIYIYIYIHEDNDIDIDIDIDVYR